MNSKNVKTFEFSNNKHELSKPLNSIGKTKNPDGFKGFYSALNIIHIYNLHDGNYRGICSNCYNYVYNTHCYNKSKCDHHEHVYNAPMVTLSRCQHRTNVNIDAMATLTRCRH